MNKAIRYFIVDENADMYSLINNVANMIYCKIGAGNFDTIRAGLTTAIKRESVLRLDTLGITINMDAAIKDYADELYISKDLLSDDQRAWALLIASRKYLLG